MRVLFEIARYLLFGFFLAFIAWSLWQSGKSASETDSNAAFRIWGFLAIATAAGILAVLTIAIP